MDIQLYPPVGTNYFKSYTVTLPGESLFSMTATFYVYVTNAKPTDPHFTANGGKVFIVVVYDGLIGGLKDAYSFGLIELSSLLSCIQQFPITGSEVKQGNNYLYTIDYAQTMSMYNSGGSAPYNFPALYKKTFSLAGYKQNSDAAVGGGQWNWWMNKYGDTGTSTINGLQIFEANTLAVANCSLFQWRGSTGPYEYMYDLDFSAKTMANAGVGEAGERV